MYSRRLVVALAWLLIKNSCTNLRVYVFCQQMYTDERAQWSEERLNLTNVHGHLEEELDEIARELSNAGLTPGSM
jgi:hypothetical protein